MEGGGFRCPVCGRLFKNRMALLAHMRVHKKPRTEVVEVEAHKRVEASSEAEKARKAGRRRRRRPQAPDRVDYDRILELAKKVGDGRVKEIKAELAKAYRVAKELTENHPNIAQFDFHNEWWIIKRGSVRYAICPDGTVHRSSFWGSSWREADVEGYETALRIVRREMHRILRKLERLAS